MHGLVLILLLRIGTGRLIFSCTLLKADIWTLVTASQKIFSVLKHIIYLLVSELLDKIRNLKTSIKHTMSICHDFYTSWYFTALLPGVTTLEMYNHPPSNSYHEHRGPVKLCSKASVFLLLFPWCNDKTREWGCLKKCLETGACNSACGRIFVHNPTDTLHITLLVNHFSKRVPNNSSFLGISY